MLLLKVQLAQHYKPIVGYHKGEIPLHTAGQVGNHHPSSDLKWIGPLE